MVFHTEANAIPTTDSDSISPPFAAYNFFPLLTDVKPNAHSENVVPGDNAYAIHKTQYGVL